MDRKGDAAQAMWRGMARASKGRWGREAAQSTGRVLLYKGPLPVLHLPGVQVALIKPQPHRTRTA